jgi:anti-sigma-K factor RskA
MQYRNKAELRERLASEYVLGTLGGGARRRFQTWLANDAALRQTVDEWETRLSPMAVSVREVAPPKSVWLGVEKRIGARAPSAGQAATKPSLWESLSFWRGLGLGASGCAAALMAFVAFRPAQVIEVPKIQIVEKTVERIVEKPVQVAMPMDGTRPWQPSYVATLFDDTGKTKIMIYAGRKANEMWIKYEGNMPTDQSLQIWGIDKQGKPDASLGIIRTTGKDTMKIEGGAEKMLLPYPQLAVTMEPMGGSPTGKPSGKVMYKGPCTMLW